MQELEHFSSEIVCKKEIVLHLLLLQSLTASLPAALHFGLSDSQAIPHTRCAAGRPMFRPAGCCPFVTYELRPTQGLAEWHMKMS